MFSNLSNYILGAGFNLAIALLIVRFIYYPRTRDKNYVLTFLAFNTVIYFVLGLLTSIELSIGVGFGLFALFSVLRYRADEIPIREMTYLFIVIALPVMNSALTSSGDLIKVMIANTVMVVLLFVLEKGWGFRFEVSKRITYEKIDLVTPDKRELLLDDLRKRTGLPVRLAQVGRIDFVKDTADITIYYEEPR